MFTLTIQTDGAAFAGGDDVPAYEIGLCLERVLVQLARGGTDGLVRDTNGNTCGSWTLAEDLELIDCPDCWPHDPSDCECVSCAGSGRVQGTPDNRADLERVQS